MSRPSITAFWALQIGWGLCNIVLLSWILVHERSDLSAETPSVPTRNPAFNEVRRPAPGGGRKTTAGGDSTRLVKVNARQAVAAAGPLWVSHAIPVKLAPVFVDGLRIDARMKGQMESALEEIRMRVATSIVVTKRWDRDRFEIKAVVPEATRSALSVEMATVLSTSGGARLGGLLVEIGEHSGLPGYPGGRRFAFSRSGEICIGEIHALDSEGASKLVNRFTLLRSTYKEDKVVKDYGIADEIGMLFDRPSSVSND